MSQLLIKGGLCANASGAFAGDLLIDEGRIVDIGQGLGKAAETGSMLVVSWFYPAESTFTCISPGPTGAVVSADDFASGTRAAACGGVTTVLDFVIPQSHESLADALQGKLAAASSNAWVDYGLHLNIRGEIDGQLGDIPDLVSDGFPSFKVFMAYDGFRLSDADLFRVMQAVGLAGGVLGVHAEDGALVDQATSDLLARGERALACYPLSRPPRCEVTAIQRILSYAEQLGTRLHIHHVSTGAGAELIGEARRKGRAITGETCPRSAPRRQQLHGEATRAASLICAPPLRKPDDRTASVARVGAWEPLGPRHGPLPLYQIAKGSTSWRFHAGAGWLGWS